MRLLFDIEGEVPEGTKGDYADATKQVFCIVTIDLDTDEVCEFRPHQIKEGLAHLGRASLLAGHNITRYDLPVLARLHGFNYRDIELHDTLCMSDAAFPGATRWKEDSRLTRTNKHMLRFPKKLMGKHSLESWGWRVNDHKEEYAGGFDAWSEEMQAYCVQDCRTNVSVYRFLSMRVPANVSALESRVSTILYRQQKHGVPFDRDSAVALMLPLAKEQEDLATELTAMVPEWWAPKGKPVVPKRDLRSKKYAPGELGFKDTAKDCEYQPMELIEFNPGSAEHIIRLFKRKYRWQPQEFAPKGQPKTGYAVLNELPYPEAPKLARYGMLTKLLQYLSEGNNGWLKHVRAGRLHGRVRSVGTVTHRMSHSSPNLGNVPSAKKPYGKECRRLFKAPAGKRIVGCDAAQLQLRLLAHYVARYDGGAFASVFTSDDPDPHTYMMKGTGIPSREHQKTFTYAMLFGAFDHRLGMTIINGLRSLASLDEWDGTVPRMNKARSIGKTARRGLSKLLNASALDKALAASVKRKHLLSLDGRRLPVPSQHRALVTLLQGGEAVVMKMALVECDNLLHDQFGPAGDTWEFVLNVHDEWQVEADTEIAEGVGKIMSEAFINTGHNLNLRVPLSGDYSVGLTWGDTH
jgi:DNA polymerase-1